MSLTADNIKTEENEHWADIFVEEENSTSSADNDIQDDESETSAKFKCRHCNYTTDWKNNLRKHVISKHLSSDKIKWFDCEYCDYKGKTREYLNLHLKTSHKEFIKWHKCSECSFKTKLARRLQNHITNVHTSIDNINWFKCDHCPYMSKLKCYMKRHMKEVHDAQANEEKCYSCDQCDFKSKLPTLVKQHRIAKHATDEEILWYRCGKCPHQTKLKSYLKRHLELWHPKEDHNNFYCTRGSGASVLFEEESCFVKTFTNGVCYKCGFCDYFSNVSKYKTVLHVKQSHNLVAIWKGSDV